MSNRIFKIGDRKLINQKSNCYLIAEIGHNHMGSLDTCLKMILSAKKNGASAVKIQKRNNKKLFTKSYYNSPYLSQNSYGKTYGEHREFLEFKKDQYKVLIEFSKKNKIDFFSTAFDIESLNFLLNLDIKMIKVASADLKNYVLLKEIALSKKPFILSTGGANIEDVLNTYEFLCKFHENFSILQCTSGYPAKYEELNLNVIAKYMQYFPKNIIGLSSHDNGIAMPVVAYTLGARIIEKHFTLDRTNKGTDHAFSLEPLGLKKLRRDLDRTKLALGDGVKKIYSSEIEPISKMSKMIVAKKNLKKGHKISLKDLDFKSPNIGENVSEIHKFIGKKLNKAKNQEDPILLKDIF